MCKLLYIQNNFLSEIKLERDNVYNYFQITVSSIKET
jgi:hypothetical protein